MLYYNVLILFQFCFFALRFVNKRKICIDEINQGLTGRKLY